MRAILCCCLGLGVLAGADLEVVETRWGFADQVVINQINPLTVVLANRTDQPYQGFIRLQEKSFTSARGLSCEAPPVFIPPGEQRPVSFMPWVGSNAYGWRLEYALFRFLDVPTGRDRQQETLEKTCVYLRPLGEGPSTIPAPLRRFPPELFPLSGAACDALGLVLLDQAPRWAASPQRAQALCDWVHGGGTLVLTRQTDGSWPELSGPLAALAQASGCGRVIRLDQPLAAINPAHFQALAASCQPEPRNQPNGRYDHLADPLAANLQQGFSHRVRPSFNWPLIFLVAIAYLLVISLGLWLHGRRPAADWRVHLLLFFGLVGTTTAVLFHIGRRGFNEAAAVQSLALLTDLGNGRLRCERWVDLFAIRGDRYLLTHGPDGQGTWDSPVSTDAVEGGCTGSLAQVGIAPYSDRFVHGLATVSGSSGLQVQALPGEGEWPRLQVQGGGAIRLVVARRGWSAYSYQQQGGMWIRHGQALPAIAGALRATSPWQHERVARQQSLFEVCDGESTNVLQERLVDELPIWRRKRLHVFVLCDDPQTACPSVHDSEGRTQAFRQEGLVLHHCELDIPTESLP